MKRPILSLKHKTPPVAVKPFVSPPLALKISTSALTPADAYAKALAVAQSLPNPPRLADLREAIKQPAREIRKAMRLANLEILRPMVSELVASTPEFPLQLNERDMQAFVHFIKAKVTQPPHNFKPIYYFWNPRDIDMLMMKAISHYRFGDGENDLDADELKDKRQAVREAVTTQFSALPVIQQMLPLTVDALIQMYHLILPMDLDDLHMAFLVTLARSTLQQHVSQLAYQQSLVEQEFTHNLDGSIAEPISQSMQDEARHVLKVAARKQVEAEQAATRAAKAKV